MSISTTNHMGSYNKITLPNGLQKYPQGKSNEPGYRHHLQVYRSPYRYNTCRLATSAIARGSSAMASDRDAQTARHTRANVLTRLPAGRRRRETPSHLPQPIAADKSSNKNKDNNRRLMMYEYSNIKSAQSTLCSRASKRDGP